MLISVSILTSSQQEGPRSFSVTRYSLRDKLISSIRVPSADPLLVRSVRRKSRMDLESILRELTLSDLHLPGRVLVCPERVQYLLISTVEHIDKSFCCWWISHTLLPALQVTARSFQVSYSRSNELSTTWMLLSLSESVVVSSPALFFLGECKTDVRVLTLSSLEEARQFLREQSGRPSTRADIPSNKQDRTGEQGMHLLFLLCIASTILTLAHLLT